jgi:hypothetical protein
MNEVLCIGRLVHSYLEPTCATPIRIEYAGKQREDTPSTPKHVLVPTVSLYFPPSFARQYQAITDARKLPEALDFWERVYRPITSVIIRQGHPAGKHYAALRAVSPFDWQDSWPPAPRFIQTDPEWRLRIQGIYGCVFDWRIPDEAQDGAGLEDCMDDAPWTPQMDLFVEGLQRLR